MKEYTVIKKYTVYEGRFESRCDLRKFGATEDDIRDIFKADAARSGDWASDTLGSFDTLADAEAELERFYPSSCHEIINNAWFVTGKLAWIEEEHVNVEADCIEESHILSWNIQELALHPCCVPPVIKHYLNEVIVEYNDHIHCFDFDPQALDIFSASPAYADPYDSQDDAEEAFTEAVKEELDAAFPALCWYFTSDEIEDFVWEITRNAMLTINDSWSNQGGPSHD